MLNSTASSSSLPRRILQAAASMNLRMSSASHGHHPLELASTILLSEIPTLRFVATHWCESAQAHLAASILNQFHPESDPLGFAFQFY
ncbi:hypothetical protein KC19_11G082600 [Ceratodon purpureus]|uniref:Uncharacterized protein n=1 Tax=Ceratodon purpureus TaxID=3225 RepID=A0A8T0GDS2_CERPU|nr:hypothetical protein KC19_11G082600 [Ceratodon purpureus]